MFNETLRKFGERDAYAFVGEKPISYFTANRQIQSIISFLENNGIIPGDKVAILSTNMPNWGITYFAVTFMGAVAVPILPDFSNIEVGNVLEHSGAKAMFISSTLLPRIEGFKSDDLRTIISIEDYSFISSEKNSFDFNPSGVPVNKYVVKEDDLASIIYTSGTTGRSKGVMLTHKNITFNALKGCVIQPMDETEKTTYSGSPASGTVRNKANCDADCTADY